MIYGHRITQIRELLHLSKEQLAQSVCVSVATIKNWENGKSNPKRLNLELLASALHTTTDYLEGMTDNPSCVQDSAKTVQESSAVNVCEICGKPVPERLRKCIPCRWKTRWPDSLLNSSRLETRRQRSHLTCLLSLDREKPEAVFGSSTDENRSTYFTTLETCTCRDFEITHGEIPCKHILRLAGELGLFQSENEDDYTLHVAVEKPKFEGKSNCKFGKYGFVEIGFQIEFTDKPVEWPMGRPSYLPSDSQMAEWKSKLHECKSIQEGTQLIADLKLTIPKIRAFAEYLGIDLRGCVYLKAEIVKRFLEDFFGIDN